MSFIKILPVVALGLAACGTADKDDTSDVNFDDSGVTNEPAAAPTSEPPAYSLTPDAVFFGFRTVVEGSVNVGAISTENGPFYGEFVVYLADYAAWEGESDFDNACGLIFELNPDQATLNDAYISAGAWVAWDFDPSTFVGTSPSCDSLNEDYLPLVDKWSTNMFTIGFSPLSSDSEDGLRGALSEEQLADWDTDWAPYFFDAAVDVDGLGEFYPINLGRLFALNEDGTTATADEDGNPDPNGEYLLPVSVKDEAGENLTYAQDGYYVSIPFGGLNPDYFLQ